MAVLLLMPALTPVGLTAAAQEAPRTGAATENRGGEAGMDDGTDGRATVRASGGFEVTLTPQATGEAGGGSGEGAKLGRMILDKRFQGDLEGTSEGEMLTAMAPVQGSAAYVAVERFSGTLHGRSGGFALVHRGVMDRGGQSLSITIVPDSGTGALTGIRGVMGISIAEGRHSYTLDYSLPDTPAP
ncbi:DUF3224 domain-containing protein [Rhodospirillum centenum]|nr:DUF3224 domain-containing protein [Rhodospirillum centenum]